MCRVLFFLFPNGDERVKVTMWYLNGTRLLIEKPLNVTNVIVINVAGNVMSPVLLCHYR